MHQKRERSFLNCIKFISTSSKAHLVFSLQTTHIRASGATFYALRLLFHLLQFQLNINFFTVSSITQDSPNQQDSHHDLKATWQWRRRWSTSSLELLHIKHQLMYVTFLFLWYSTDKITPLLRSEWKKHIFLSTFGIQTNLCWNATSFLTRSFS